jgi:hypothetical protein
MSQRQVSVEGCCERRGGYDEHRSRNGADTELVPVTPRAVAGAPFIRWYEGNPAGLALRFTVKRSSWTLALFAVENAPHQAIPMGPLRLVSIVDDDESARLATESLVHSLGWPTHTCSQCRRRAPTGRVPDFRCAHARHVGHRDVQAPARARRCAADAPHDSISHRCTARAGGRDWRLGLLDKPLDVAALERHLTRVLGTP